MHWQDSFTNYLHRFIRIIFYDDDNENKLTLTKASIIKASVNCYFRNEMILLNSA